MIATAAILAALAGGCGGDEEPADTGATPPPATDTASDRTEPTKPARPPKTDTAAPQSTPSPEDTQEGGAGDETQRSQALLTGRRGRITPRLIRVAPYIAVRVELRSADGASYSLRIGRRRIRAGGQISSASSQFAGLRPGKSLVGRGSDGGRIRIVANAEPGP